MKIILSCVTVFVFCVTVFTSCRKVTCQNPSLNFRFSGFDTADLREIRVRVYHAGTNTLISDTIVNCTDAPIILPDGSQMFNPGNIYISYPGRDYVLDIVSLQKEYKLTEFGAKQRKYADGGFMGEAELCSNMVYYKQNGQQRNSGKIDRCSYSCATTVYITNE